MLFLFALLSPVFVRATETADWPQFGRTPDFQSFNDIADTAATGAEWSFKAADRMVASPAVAFGRVWFGSDDGHMYCMNKSTGKLLWSFEVPNPDPKCAGNEAEHGLCPSVKVRSSPAVDSKGNVYFGSYDFNVYKLDLDGKLVWKFSTGGSVYGPVTFDVDGLVFVGSFDNNLYAINAESGAKKWSFDVQAHADSGWSIAGDMVLGLSNEGGLCTSWPPPDCPWPNKTAGGGNCYAYGIRKATGELVWKQYTGMPAGGGMVVGDTFYGGSWSGDLVAYDVQTGKKKWTFSAGGMLESHPAYHNGTVFISTESQGEDAAGILYALDAATGKEVWRYTGAEDEFNGSPSVSHDTVYAGSNDQYLHAVDRKTGVLKFKFKTCANVFSSAAIDDQGRIYIACNTMTGGTPWVGVGEAYAINPQKHLDSLRSLIV